MEEYIKEKYIVKNEVYEALKESVTCSICMNLMINPMVCPKCQNKMCKPCLDKWKAKGGKCPNGCDSEFQKVIEKNNLITKIKFKCIKGCGEEILFNDLQKHYSSNCMKKMKRISTEKLLKLPKKKKNTKYFTSKNI